MTPAVLIRLTQEPWPGNVRELENLIERLVVVATRPTIEVDDLAAQLVSPPRGAGFEDEGGRLRTLRELEDAYVAWVLARCDGNKTRAAEILGLDVSTLHRRARRDG